MLPLLHPSPSLMLGCAPFPLCVGLPALVETCCQKFLVPQSPKPQPSNPVPKKKKNTPLKHRTGIYIFLFNKIYFDKNRVKYSQHGYLSCYSGKEERFYLH